MYIYNSNTLYIVLPPVTHYFLFSSTNCTSTHSFMKVASRTPSYSSSVFIGYQLSSIKRTFGAPQSAALGTGISLALLTVVCCNLFILFAFSLSLPSVSLSFSLYLPAASTVFVFFCCFCYLLCVALMNPVY